MEFQFCDKNKEIPFNFDKIIFDKKLNYELTLTNDDKNNQNISYKKNNNEIKENEEIINIKNKKENIDENKNN